MILESELREKMRLFVSGHISIREFDSWLISASWEMHRDGSASDAQVLASEVQLRLLECEQGEMNRAELNREIMSLLNIVVLSVRISTDATNSVGLRVIGNAMRVIPLIVNASGVTGAPVLCQARA